MNWKNAANASGTSTNKVTIGLLGIVLITVSGTFGVIQTADGCRPTAEVVVEVDGPGSGSSEFVIVDTEGSAEGSAEGSGSSPAP